MIKITQRYRPYSHRPGLKLILPYTNIPVTSYPTRLEIGDEAIDFPYTGPVEQFTTELDLDRGRIHIWGHAKEGYFERTLEGKGEEWSLNEKKEWERPPLEKLSLGCHKKQDWDLVLRRGDLAEILPFWFALGQQVEGQEIEVKSLRELFLGCFEGLLFPTSGDRYFQGILQGQTFDPMSVLYGGTKAIRNLFIRDEGTIALLPDLPKEFHAGRLIGLQTSAGLMDIEWSKKTLKKVRLIPTMEKVNFVLPKGLKSFRVNKTKRVSSLECTLGNEVWMDRFE